jgi:hypothetical protein
MCIVLRRKLKIIICFASSLRGVLFIAVSLRVMVWVFLLHISASVVDESVQNNAHCTVVKELACADAVCSVDVFFGHR